MAVRRIVVTFETDSDDDFKEIALDEYVNEIEEAMDRLESRAHGAPDVTITVKANG